jgi:hypothetical protein
VSAYASPTGTRRTFPHFQREIVRAERLTVEAEARRPRLRYRLVNEKPSPTPRSPDGYAPIRRDPPDDVGVIDGTTDRIEK